MFTNDIFNVLNWFLVSLLLGITFLPLTFLLFSGLRDKGYIFSKIIGIAFISYFVFIFGTTRILSFSSINIALLLIISFFCNYFFIFKKKSLIRRFFSEILEKNYSLFILEETIFLCSFSLWAFIKTFAPNINGLEKFMDFGFINSILRGDFFPAKDIWFTPLPINYYYFGHLTTAVLTKISGIPSSITFNLMQALIFALCFSAAFSIGINLFTFVKESVNKKFNTFKMIIAGILTSLLVTLSGNLHIVYAFFKVYQGENPVPLSKLAFLPFSFPNSYWYPNATRFIHNTIHEFPSYSWVVSDLHGHVLDIPYVLLTIVFLITVFITKKINYLKIVFLSFLTAILYMTNAWDGAIYLGLAIVLIFFNSFQGFKDKKQKLKNFVTKKELIKPFLYCLTLLFGYFIFSLPFNLFFKPFVSGIGLLCAPGFLIAKGRLGPLLFEANHCQKSPFWQLLTLYGFFYFWVLSFLIFMFIKVKKKILKTTRVDWFIFVLIIFSTLLLITPEFIYFKDIYPLHYRANTMFKLGYQAFILLSICSGYIIVRIFSQTKKSVLFIIYFLISVTMISLVLIYPYLAISSYYNGLQNQQSLNGTKYLEHLYPNDYKAIEWINKNIQGQPVILEAQGDSYTDYARVSANTGLPTVLGWTVHEWLWRGTYDIPAPRIEDVKQLYESISMQKTRKLIKKYNISYVFIGDLEREKYNNLNEEKFNRLGKVIYNSGLTRVYKINYQF
jgi:YYY domain-containing protein